MLAEGKDRQRNISISNCGLHKNASQTVMPQFTKHCPIDGNPFQNYLTRLADRALSFMKVVWNENVSKPKMVSLSDNRFLSITLKKFLQLNDTN